MKGFDRIYGTWTVRSIQEIAQDLNTSLEQGLSDGQVQKHALLYGRNQLPQAKHTWFYMLVEQFKSPFLLILFFVAFLMFVLGDTVNAFIVLAIILFNSLFSFYQEYRAESSLSLLMKFLTARVTVIRNGKEQDVVSTSLVPGDVVVLYPGDIIPADIRFFKQDHAVVDESALTGESEPVPKTVESYARAPRDVSEATNIGFSGTTLLTGKAMGIVIAIGSSSMLGKIAQLTADTIRVSGFSRSIAQLTKFLVYLSVVTVGIVFCAHFFMQHSASDMIQLFMFTAALGVTIIPEALPLVITLSLTRGAWRLAQHDVVVKRLSAIDDLGSLEVLCTDKTGTLTQNKLSVQAVYARDEQEAIFCALLASGLTTRNLSVAKGFDAGLLAYIDEADKKRLEEYKLITEIPFDSGRRCGFALLQGPSGCELIVRGAADKVLSLCSDGVVDSTLQIWIAQQARQARRIIAVGVKRKSCSYEMMEYEKGFELVGLIAFEDPLKPTAKEAVEHAQQLGVQIKIISGDSPEACSEIARQVGIIQSSIEVITGSEFDAKSPEEKMIIVDQCAVFARISPAQKYEIIQLLQKTYYVGYMGDGINDAPALKIANVALAVDDATDVAKDAADIILLHKSLRIIIDGIHEGRAIFANTVKYLKITLAGNLGNFYALATASLLIDYLPMLPTQLLLLNFLSDLPLIALSTDTVDEADVCSPQKYDIKDIAFVSLILSLVSTVFDFILFAMFYRISPQVLQTNWFIISVLNELVFIFSIRTRHLFYKAVCPSRELLTLSFVTAGITLLLPYTTIGQTLFSFVAPTAHQLSIVFGLTIAFFITSELIKWLYYRFSTSK